MSSSKEGSSKEYKELEAKGIEEGDVVRTAFRGGERKGVVKHIATTEEETKHPPKVIFDRERPGQEPKEVAHNPSTLEKGERWQRIRAWHAFSITCGLKITLCPPFFAVE